MKRTANFLTASAFAIALLVPCSAFAFGAVSGVSVGGIGNPGGLNGAGTAGYITRPREGYPWGSAAEDRARGQENASYDDRNPDQRGRAETDNNANASSGGDGSAAAR